MRIAEAEAFWMSVKTHSTTVVNLDNIFVTGLVPGGYDKASHDARMSPTCRFANRSYGLGKASDASDAVVVMNKSRTCKTSELCQVSNTVIVSQRPIVPESFDKAWVHIPVPQLNRTLGTWPRFLQICQAYDVQLIPLMITSFILICEKPNFIGQDFEAVLRLACQT